MWFRNKQNSKEECKMFIKSLNSDETVFRNSLLMMHSPYKSWQNSPPHGTTVAAFKEHWHQWFWPWCYLVNLNQSLWYRLPQYWERVTFRERQGWTQMQMEAEQVQLNDLLSTSNLQAGRHREQRNAGAQKYRDTGAQKGTWQTDNEQRNKGSGLV